MITRATGINTLDRQHTLITATFTARQKRPPFDLLLSRPPPPFTLDPTADSASQTKRFSRNEFLKRLEASLVTARTQRAKTQQRYKDDFDKRVRRTNRKLRYGDFV